MPHHSRVPPLEQWRSIAEYYNIYCGCVTPNNYAIDCAGLPRGQRWGRFNRGWITLCQGKKGGGLNMVSKWSQFEIEQKTTNLAQSKIYAKIMNNKEKVLKRSGSYGWT